MYGGILLCQWEGRKGGRSATKKQKRPDEAWPDQAGRPGREVGDG
jgi:hypothetical protein